MEKLTNCLFFFLLFFLVATTHDQNVFSFYPNNRCCNGFEEALARYREIVPHLKLSGFHEFPCLRHIYVLLFLISC